MAEVAALPGVDAEDFEFIELVNTGSTVADLQGVALTRTMADGELVGVEFAFADGVVASLGPGERVVVAENLAAYQLRYGSISALAGRWQGRLSNRAEQLTLTVNQTVLQQLTYQDSWHPATDGGGRSLEIINANEADSGVWEQAEGWLPRQFGPAVPQDESLSRLAT